MQFIRCIIQINIMLMISYIDLFFHYSPLNSSSLMSYVSYACVHLLSQKKWFLNYIIIIKSLFLNIIVKSLTIKRKLTICNRSASGRLSLNVELKSRPGLGLNETLQLLMAL